MWKMDQIRNFRKKILAPVTIMFIQHHHAKHSFNMNIPMFLIPLIAVLCTLGVIYTGSVVMELFRYQVMEDQLRDYSAKVAEFNAALTSVKKMESDLKTLISYGSKEKILENVDTADMGTMDIYQIEKQIQVSMNTVASINEFLRTQKDIYLSTPRGFPIDGRITSLFGSRANPVTGRVELHRGIDIAAPSGTNVKATADGVVSFSGWNGGGGNTVVIEHGHGFSSCYAHNRANKVTVGQRVKRGETVSYVGATGNATGSHVHYEIWQGGRVINPKQHMEGSRVQ
ncbi:MAG: M23 family metallopeptidase [Syntrophales bacterium]|jgi:murein DD-endopeptidase MepM/ murein hydrolase activator NlpD|nr:M23 family metallopeptidase [Syntrophales bacterium]MCK9390107.1 M23 family metallopeptidase [Syntrophales bacterium]